MIANTFNAVTTGVVHPHPLLHDRHPHPLLHDRHPHPL
jgi:hypothetical protein